MTGKLDYPWTVYTYYSLSSAFIYRTKKALCPWRTGKHNNKNRVGARLYNNNNYPERVFSEKKPIHIRGEGGPFERFSFLRLHLNNNLAVRAFLWISFHTDRTVNGRRRTCGTRECRFLRNQKQIDPYTPHPFYKGYEYIIHTPNRVFFCPFQTTRREVVRGRRGLTLFFKILTQMIVFILPRPANYNGIYRLKTSRTSINQQRTARGSFYIMFRFVTVQ